MRSDTKNGDVTATSPPDESIGLLDVLLAVGSNLRRIVFWSLLAGSLALCATYLVKPVFTSRTMILPPQQQQSAAASALASLGSLAGIAGSAAAVKSPAEQYVSLMQSHTVLDRIIDKLDLQKVYGVKLKLEARHRLQGATSMVVGKKDGLITVEVSSTDPVLAANVANAYVEELRRLSSTLAITEPQQRRAFFELQLQKTRDRLAKAQEALEASGFNPNAIKAEPRAAAEAYARLYSELASAEIRLQALMQSLAEGAPEVQQQRSIVNSLQQRVNAAASGETSGTPSNYIALFREYKYQESLFEAFSRQYEAARLDEAREGSLIQVVDRAMPPEKKSKPRRGVTAVTSTLLAFLLLTVAVIIRQVWRRSEANSAYGHRFKEVGQVWRAAFGLKSKT